ncbi:MAG: protein-L-isoaspartate(D-aspartate) O-methyltransferase [Myxococcota bacterium]
MAERLANAGVDDTRVLAAFASVPRHELIPGALSGQAYRDTALPIGEGQTISQPSVVGVMTQALELSGEESVLEIGTGSAYQAAILSQLCQRVISVERKSKLAAQARQSLDRLGIHNVLVFWGDGTKGRPAEGPFDAIVVTAGGPEVPKPLLTQLAIGGRLVGPFGARDEQRLQRIRRVGEDAYTREWLGRVRFVDLVGDHGWHA